ncbi:MAG: ornithine cyclodeaminase family protein [Rhizobiales bacterium]|nr:ornithine cyclodeaminase family protein [Hyphomicrobiales bacterium]
MRVVAAAEVDRRLDFPALIAALARAFASGYAAPQRHHHEIAREGAAHATQLLMPAWTQDAPGEGAFLGVKIVNVFPDNGARGLPAVNGVYVLQNGATGEPLAVMDGARLTVWRTAAASALAASRLARADAATLCMVGAGALAPFLIRAHAAVRPIRRVTLWNRRREASETLAAALDGFEVRVEDDLERAVAQADIVSCATLSRAPLVQGRWLKPGQHLDLVGAFNLQMREADDEAVRRARVFVDTPAALTEGGDVALALAADAIDRAHVLGDLAALCRGAEGRGADDEITLFKSVGASIEDLAAAMLVWSRLTV